MAKLIEACRYGDYNTVVEQLHNGADPNAQYHGDVPLLAACRCDYLGIVKALLAASANPNAIIDDANVFYSFILCFTDTPLLAACRCGSLDVVEALLEANADPNCSNREGVCPLLVAAHEGNVDIVLSLLRAGADPNKSCLVLREYFNQDVDVDYENLFFLSESQHVTNVTPLMLTYNSKVVDALVNANADVNRRSGGGRTALFFAAYMGRDSAVKALLAAGADPNIADD